MSTTRTGIGKLQRDDTLRMLNFENDRETLWKRIGQASLFVDFVLETKQRIIGRVDRLCEELREETGGIKGFPLQVFTRSLRKITDILEGSIGTKEPEGTTQKLQYTTPGTLGHALKELKVAQATEKLGQLAAEVGLTLDSADGIAAGGNQRHDRRGFRDLAKDYQRERERLDDLSLRIAALAAELADAPADFVYPASVPQLRRTDRAAGVHRKRAQRDAGRGRRDPDHGA